MDKIQDDIDALGLNQTSYAWLLGVTPQIVRMWISGKSKRSAVAERYTRLLLKNPDMVSQAWVIAGYPPEGPPVSKAGRPVERKED